MKICDIIDEILNYETPRKRLGTQEMHRIYLSQLRLEIGELDIKNFGRKDFQIWIADFKKRNSQRKTFDDYTKFVNIISNYAYQQKYTTHLLKFPNTDIKKGSAGRIYSQAELKRLFLGMNNVTKLQFILSVECFMRLREVLHLTWDRVDLDNKKIILRAQDVKTGSRTGKGRSIPLSDNACSFLATRKVLAKTEWVFPNPQKDGPTENNKSAWCAAKRWAEIKGRARWHDLRHTALSYAVVQMKLPIVHVSQVAGLSIRTLERVYLHSEVDQLREITNAKNILEIA